MTNEQKIMILKHKVKFLEGSPSAIKCPGVLRKLRRQVRNLEKLIGA